MKRIIAAIVLTLIIFSVSLTGRFLISDSIRYIQNEMTEIDKLLSEGDTGKAMLECDAFLRVWDKHHGRLCMFIQHEHLDPLENIFSVLPIYIEQEEAILARAECRTAKSLTEHIVKTEQITLENIL